MRRKTRQDRNPNPPRIQNLPIGADGHLQERRDERRCPACGQKIEPGQAGFPHHHDFFDETEATGTAARVGPARWFAVALLSVVAAAVFVGWRDTSEPTGAPETARPVTSVDDNQDAATDSDEEDADGAQERLEAARSAAALLIGQYRIAYAAAEGVAVVNPAAAHEPVSIVDPVYANMNDLLAGFGSFVMYDQQGRTYGFQLSEGSDELTIYSLSSRGQVVVAEDKSIALAFDSAGSPAIYVGHSSGVFMASLEVPVGARVLNVPFLGVLVVSSTGETLVTTESGFSHFSDWPVLAANATHHVEIRCVDSLACTPVLVDRVIGGVSGLPTELAADFGIVTIAPDGDHLLMVNPAKGAPYPDLLYDVAADELVALANAVSGAVTWSPDSSFVGWFDSATTEPRLWVLDVDTTQIGFVDLTDLGAPLRTNEPLIFFP